MEPIEMLPDSVVRQLKTRPKLLAELRVMPWDQLMGAIDSAGDIVSNGVSLPLYFMGQEKGKVAADALATVLREYSYAHADYFLNGPGRGSAEKKEIMEAKREAARAVEGCTERFLALVEGATQKCVAHRLREKMGIDLREVASAGQSPAA